MNLISCLLVLHPGLKLDYFHVQDWEEKWIDVAKNLVREEYISEYENLTPADENAYTADQVSDNSFTVGFSILTYYASRQATMGTSATSALARAFPNEARSTPISRLQSKT